MKQYRLQPGTSSRIFYLLTVKDNGSMLLHFKGTDRSFTQEVNEDADGWITTNNGSKLPPLDNKKWLALPYPATLSGETSEPMTDTSKKEESKEDSESAEHAPLSTVTNVTTVTPAQSQSKDSNTAMTAKQYYSAELNFEDGPDNHLTRKIVAGVLTAVVVIALVNTIGVFGVAGLGILAGGCVK